MRGQIDRTARAAGRVAIVLKGYPRLSETFIAQEIRELERRGLEASIWSLRLPTDSKIHPVHREIRANVTYLPEYVRDDPARVWRSWRSARQLSGYKAARTRFLRDLTRDPTPNRLRRFAQALVLAAELPPDVGHIYSHFLHTPSSVALYAASMRGLPWSFSAHAKDIWTIPAWEKQEKLAAADWAVTCSRYGYDHLRALCGENAAKLELVRHGLDLARFRPERQSRDGSAVRLLTVSRAVPKKGVDVILNALAQLPPELPWEFVHAGGGPLLGALKSKAAALGLADRITWRGALAQEEVLSEMRRADIFVLASRIAKDGDRDGLPNVLLEALSQGVPVVATAVAAIPELISDGHTGRLVPPDNPETLASVIVELAADAEGRRRLGRAGEARVRNEFDLQSCIGPLASRFALRENAQAAE